MSQRQSDALEQLASLLDRGAAIAERYRPGKGADADLRTAASAARARAESARRVEDALTDLAELGQRFDEAMHRAQGQMRKFAHLLQAPRRRPEAA